MKVVSDRQTREATEKQLKETELSRVKINKEDIDLIVSEQLQFSTSKQSAFCLLPVLLLLLLSLLLITAIHAKVNSRQIS